MLANLLEGGGVIVLAVLGLADAWRLAGVVRTPGAILDVIGPDRYLAVVAGGLFACGLAYLWQRLRPGTQARPPRRPAGEDQPLQVALVSVILVLYVAAFPVLGYLLASTLFFPATFFVFGVRPWLKSAWVGVIAAALFYVLFNHFAEIPLPRGFLELGF